MSLTLSHLPDLKSGYALTEAQRAAYQHDGHIKLPGVTTAAEIAAYRRPLAETLKNYLTETRPLEERDTYGKAFLKTENLWLKDDACRQFVLARRFAKIAADLMGVEAVRIYHDQAIFKEPCGSRTPWHQDLFYWPLDTDNAVTMWIALTDISKEMGSMTFASGSHKERLFASLQISDESDAFFLQHIAERQYPLADAGFLAAGDATFHSGWTLHSAPGNASRQMREAMTVIYYADGTRVLSPDETGHGWDRDVYLPGCKPGDLAAGDINPIVYRRGE